jgi:hypothetical protein
LDDQAELEANYAVPTHELALDGRVVEAAVNFEEEIAAVDSPPWDSFWMEADPPTHADASATLSDRSEQLRVGSSSSAAGHALSWSIPLEVKVQIRSEGPRASIADASNAAIEALVEPFREEDLSNRHGYDDRFLGIRVPVPRVLDKSLVSLLDNGSHLLPYEHFSAGREQGAPAGAVPRIECRRRSPSKDARTRAGLHQERPDGSPNERPGGMVH